MRAASDYVKPQRRTVGIKAGEFVRIVLLKCDFFTIRRCYCCVSNRQNKPKTFGDDT